MVLDFGLFGKGGLLSGGRGIYSFPSSSFVWSKVAEADSKLAWIDNDNMKIKSRDGATAGRFMMTLPFPAGTKIISLAMYGTGVWNWHFIRYSIKADGNLYLVNSAVNNAISNLSIVLEEDYGYVLATESVTDEDIIRGAIIEVAQ